MYSAIQNLADEVEEGNYEFENIQQFRQPMVYLILESRLDEDALSDMIQGSELQETHEGNPPTGDDALKQATAYELARLYKDLDGAAERYDFKSEYWKLIRGAATAGIYNRLKPLMDEAIDDIGTDYLAGKIYAEEDFLEELGADMSSELADVDSAVTKDWLYMNVDKRSEFSQPENLSMVIFFIKQVRFFLNQENIFDNAE